MTGVLYERRNKWDVRMKVQSRDDGRWGDYVSWWSVRDDEGLSKRQRGCVSTVLGLTESEWMRGTGRIGEGQTGRRPPLNARQLQPNRRRSLNGTQQVRVGRHTSHESHRQSTPAIQVPIHLLPQEVTTNELAPPGTCWWLWTTDPT